jgi:hypothetical protein
MSNITFARRHFVKAAALTAAALAAKTAQAWTQPWSPSGPLMPLDPFAPTPLFWQEQAGAWSLVGNDLEKAQYGYGGYPPRAISQSLFDSLVAEYGPPPRFAFTAYNAAPVQQGSPLHVSAAAVDSWEDRRESNHCFLRGTPIAAVAGERPIEMLTAGDPIRVSHSTFRPLSAINHLSFTLPLRRSQIPVRIRRNAIADGVPNVDLYVSPQQALEIDDMLITAESLINNQTIFLQPATTVEYFHLDFGEPEIVYAAGLPCESYVPDREQFGVEVAALPRARDKMLSHLRSALSPWFDIRRPIDVIRDRIDARVAHALRPSA